jgi:hypothetical protein
MRGPVPFGVLVILGLCVIACGISRAQHRETPEPTRPLLQNQPSSPFAEEIKQLDAAADQAARRTAFLAILEKAGKLKRAPDPLVSILVNKKPEDSFKDLVEYIRENEFARHTSFVAPLVMASNEAGENAKPAGNAVVAYTGVDKAVPVIIRMLKSDESSERRAAAAIAGRRVAGAAGAAKMIPHLVGVLEREDVDLSAIAMRSLTKQTWIEFATAEEWKYWLKGKSENDLLAIIADNEAAARRKADDDRVRMENTYKGEALRKLEGANGDIRVLTDGLADEFPIVRAKALKLLRAVLKASLPDETAKPTIDAVGELLNRQSEPEELRRDAAGLLADCGKPVLAFPYVDRCLAANGISADLRLELVRGLNAPAAAKRLAELLKAEAAVADTRSGAVLEQLILQVRFVLEQDDQSPTCKAIIEELKRLLELIVAKVSGTLDGPSRKRFADLATRTCDALGTVVRHRGVDISSCVEPLVRLTCAESTAAGAALTALRDALQVQRARPAILEAVNAPPLPEKLADLYLRLIAGTDEVMAVSLLGLYEEIGSAPEPVDKLTQRLMDFARASEAVLPDRAGARRGVRDAIRSLLARLNTTPEQHIALVNDLLLCEYGVRDVVGYFQTLKPPRVELCVSALRPHRGERLVRVARVVVGVTPLLTEDERSNTEFTGFRDEVNTLLRARLRVDLTNALKNGFDEETRKTMTVIAASALRDQWVPVAIEKLRENADPGEARDVVSELLLSTLKKAHPGTYDNLVLAGTKEEFIKALDGLNGQLKQDGYTVP